MHEAMAATLDTAVEQIKKLQETSSLVTGFSSGESVRT
jgi:hypothetical protein